MYVGSRYLNGEKIGRGDLAAIPVKSEKIGEIFRRVRRRAGA